ncbi:MAG: cobalt ECF transporter T component CbiQ [Eubacteriaceae bacterium]|nr:cobalt ECF transporter T component CbiQ [Eubacteriaceae bacterium]
MNSIYVSLFVIIVMGFLTVKRGRIPFHQYYSTLTIPIVFVIVGSLTIALSFAKEPLGQYNLNLGWFCIYTSDADLLRMANLMAKAMGAVSALFMMTLSTPSGEIISVMRKAHIPKLFVELMNMVYRYIFVIMETNRKMHDSAESRLGYVDYKTSVKSFSGTASNLLVVSLKKANAYYDALVARGYDGDLRFLEKEKKMDREQIVLCICFFLCMGLIFAAERFRLLG